MIKTITLKFLQALTCYYCTEWIPDVEIKEINSNKHKIYIKVKTQNEERYICYI